MKKGSCIFLTLTPILTIREMTLIIVACIIICRQKGARPGDLNPDWDTSGPSFFTHFDAMERGLNLEEIPPDIVRVETESIAGRIEPPVAQSN